MKRVYRYCQICMVGFFKRDPDCWFRVPYARIDGQTGITTQIFCHNCQMQLREMLG